MGLESIRKEEATFRKTRALWVLRPPGRGPSRLETLQTGKLYRLADATGPDVLRRTLLQGPPAAHKSSVNSPACLQGLLGSSPSAKTLPSGLEPTEPSPYLASLYSSLPAPGSLTIGHTFSPNAPCTPPIIWCSLIPSMHKALCK